MPMTWIEALRVYNAGMPSWCVPKKGTPAYDTITKIRKGEPTETPKEIIDKLERKTTGKPKGQKRIVRISLEKPAMETKQEVEVPVVEDKKKRAEFQEPVAKMKKVELEKKLTDYKYDVKKHEKILKEFEGTSLVPALNAFHKHITEVNEERGNPIRNVLLSTFDEIDKKTKKKTGRTLAGFSHLISKVNKTYATLAIYAIEPKFEVVKEEKKEKKEEELPVYAYSQKDIDEYNRKAEELKKLMQKK